MVLQGLLIPMRLLPNRRDDLLVQSFYLPAPPETLSALMKRH